jgi:hypothetical protein
MTGLALADCGPCTGTGALVRDHLPPTLSPEARALILTRLEHGATTYGAPLRIGWGPAAIERLQELCDAVTYAVADPACPPEDLAAIVSLTNRATSAAIQARRAVL